MIYKSSRSAYTSLLIVDIYRSLCFNTYINLIASLIGKMEVIPMKKFLFALITTAFVSISMVSAEAATRTCRVTFPDGGSGVLILDGKVPVSFVGKFGSKTFKADSLSLSSSKLKVGSATMKLSTNTSTVLAGQWTSKGKSAFVTFYCK